MGKEDKLSRRSYWKVEVENDNKTKKVIKEEWVWNLVEVVVEGSEVDIIEKIKIARGKDKEVVRVVEEIKKAGVQVLRDDE